MKPLATTFTQNFFISHIKRLKQPAVLAHDKPIEVGTYGQVDKAEIEEIIKEMRWHRRVNMDDLADQDRLPAPATQPPSHGIWRSAILIKSEIVRCA